MASRVGVVVVAYESDAVLADCLDALDRFEAACSIVVVDNASPSGPPEVGRHELCRSPVNSGYAGGCNLGAAHPSLLRCEFLAFVSPDVRLEGPALSELAEQMVERPEIGAATGTIVDGHRNRTSAGWGELNVLRVLWGSAGLKAYRLRRLAGRLLSGGAFTSSASMVRSEMLVDGFIIGGALVVRRAAFDEIGGFDEAFFMGWDDADLCERLRGRGWQLWILPSSDIVHLGQQSSAGVVQSHRWQWYDRGCLRFIERHVPAASQRRFRAAHRVGKSFRRLVR
jgi:N-acetylglucosaminyl-diphospho-decaprenol L-rhamnosyltransferase